jgi:hypothetical protein
VRRRGWPRAARPYGGAPVLIDLLTVQTLVVSLVSADRRHRHMTSLCRRLGLDFEFIDAIECRPGWIGCGLSHLKSLQAAEAGRPLLILEDDVDAAAGFRRLVEAPDDADALYLGTSQFGAIHALDFIGAFGGVIAERVADGLLRVHNMMSTHAILYLSDRYRRATQDATIEALTKGWPHDRQLAAMQGDFAVYALEQPQFYQSAILQAEGKGERQQELTTAPLPLYEPGSLFAISTPSGPATIRLDRDSGRHVWQRADAGS